ncbi:hypothetical protein LMG28614_02853 [Paraburkholderia ultramafica]|uniref:Uncharacterized protein n=1 Tax=Paraburkholderia ultramafica TaxID=1544867 RepID=A0A6S7B6A8_9BURK|nr:hypothetical protein [Paraburkholderia ultramafica]CAB3789315.1 hypothetical protein LMG28614_02853 [Paraburkholderia ultramafica]
MTTLILNDLSRSDALDRAASQSVRGGIAKVTPEIPVENPGTTMPALIRRGWGDLPPIHIGCGPTIMPYRNLPLQPGHVVPL